MRKENKNKSSKKGKDKETLVSKKWEEKTCKKQLDM